MLKYPQINPVAWQLGPLKIYWYGLMYLLSFLLAWFLALRQAKRTGSVWTSEQVADLIFYGAMGVVIGGRVGYLLFYNFSAFLADPLLLFKVWLGGMSFHGGLLGVLLAFGLFARRYQHHYIEVLDFMAPIAPVGLALGRIGNFINGELWGRITTLPWGMVFPHVDNHPRHPSQLYEMSLEGVLLFILLQWYTHKPRPRGAAASLFLIGYGCFRFIGECFREPDVQLGFLALDWLTMGQLLSLPMIVIGLCCYVRVTRNTCNT